MFQNSVCLRAKLCCVCGMLAVGMVGYSAVEVMEWNNKKKKKEEEEEETS